MCIAQDVRDFNDTMWVPEVSSEAAPELLVNEPVILDAFTSPDGRSWIRVYMDGSTLDQNGIVRRHDRGAANERRGERVLAS